jgi:hypothetical protein
MPLHLFTGCPLVGKTQPCLYWYIFSSHVFSRPLCCILAARSDKPSLHALTVCAHLPTILVRSIQGEFGSLHFYRILYCWVVVLWSIGLVKPLLLKKPEKTSILEHID